MKLIIDKEYYITKPDAMNYTLVRIVNGTNPVTKKPTTNEKLVGYYSSPLGALKRYALDSMEDCTTVKEAIDRIENAVSNIKLSEVM